MRGLPHFIDALWLGVVISAACTLVVGAKFSLPPERWIDHPRPAARSTYRTALLLAWYLPFLACTWLTATVLVNCCTAFMYSIPVESVQLSVAGVPVL